MNPQINPPAPSTSIWNSFSRLSFIFVALIFAMLSSATAAAAPAGLTIAANIPAAAETVYWTNNDTLAYGYGLGTTTFNKGETIEISVTPAAGYVFTGWSYDNKINVTSEDATDIIFTLIGDATITANFAATAQLTIAANIPDAIATLDWLNKTTTDSGSGLGTNTFTIGNSIEVTVTPAAGYVFTGWTYDNKITVTSVDGADIIFTLNANATLTANFATISNLTIAANIPAAAASVDWLDKITGDSGSGLGANPFATGNSIEVTVTPAAGYVFTGWTYDNKITVTSVDGADIIFTLNATATLTANFATTSNLTIAANIPAAVASVDWIDNTSGDSGSGLGTNPFATGNSIGVNVTPATGYVFTGWTYDNKITVTSKTGPDIVFTLNATATLTANFADASAEIFPSGGEIPAGWGDADTSNASWFVSMAQAREGILSLSSGPIGDNELSQIEVTNNYQNVMLSFWLKTSTEKDYDFLRFYIDGELKGEWSGDTNWTQVSYQIFAGEHTLTWSYEKNGSASVGADAVYIDLVEFTALTEANLTVTANIPAAVGSLDLYNSTTDESGTTLGSYKFLVDNSIAISVTPAAGYVFTGWTYNSNITVISEVETDISFTLKSTTTVTANFAPTVQLTIAANVPAAVNSVDLYNATTDESGTALGNYQFLAGNSIALSVTPKAGYVFTGWTYDSNITVSASEGSDITFTLNAAATVTANFVSTAQLTITANIPAAVGTLEWTNNTSGDSGSGLGANTFATGDSIGITVTPVTGYFFTGWTHDNKITITSGTGPEITLTLNSTATLTANFAATGTEIFPKDGAIPDGWFETDTSNAPWFVSAAQAHEGVLSLSSGHIGDLELSQIETTADYQEGVLSFWVKTSTDKDLDFLRFHIDGELKGEWSGETDWTQVSYPIQIGTHTLTWSYEKDASNSAGADAVYVDLVGFNPAASVNLTIAVTGDGTTDPAAGTHAVYKVNDVFTADITATANPQNRFIRWEPSINCSVADVKSDSTTVTLTADATVTAVFAPMVQLTIAANIPDAVGSIDWANNTTGDSGSTLGSNMFAVGDSVGIAVVPAAGYVFRGWTHDTNITVTAQDGSDIAFNLNAAATVTANFAPTAQLTIAANIPAAVDSLDWTDNTSGDSGSGLGATILAAGDSIGVTAVPAKGYVFTGWTYDNNITVSSETGPDISFTLNSAATLTANFKYTTTANLTISANIPAAAGSVDWANTTTSDSGTGLGTTAFTPGDSIEVTVTPAAGYVFRGWTYGSGISVTSTDGADIVFAINSTATLTANFAPTVQLTIAANIPAAVGTIDWTDNTSGDSGSGTGTSTLASADSVVVTVTPAAGYFFTGWSHGAGLTVASETGLDIAFTINSDATLTANFANVSTEVFPAGGTIPEGWTEPDSSTAPWVVSKAQAHEGILSLSSAPIGDLELSQIEVTADYQNVVLSFWLKTSSDQGLDFLRFYIDGLLQGEWSGETDWTQVRYFIEQGTHTLTWSYEKDASNSAGADAVYVDLVEFNPAPSANLTMAVTGDGTTDPAVGTHTIYDLNSAFSADITATAAPQSHFIRWIPSANSTVADVYFDSTTVTLTADSTVTAKFKPDMFDLANNVPDDDIFGPKGEINMTVYRIDVPANQTYLTIKTYDGSGDCDLFVKKGNPPTTESYDFRSANLGNGEQIDISSPDAGLWYAIVYGYDSYADAKIMASYGNSLPAKPITPVASQGAFSDRITLSWGSIEGADSYEIYRSHINNLSLAKKIASTAAVEFTDVFGSKGTYAFYYWVRGSSNSTGTGAFSNSAYGTTIEAAAALLGNGVAVSSLGGAVGSMRKYKIAVPADQTLLEVKTYGGTGDCDLEVKLDSLTEKVHQFSATNGTGEKIRIEFPPAGTYLIYLYSNTAYSGVTLSAKYSSGVPAAPTGLLASDGTYADKITLTWAAAAGATSYEVLRAEGNGTAIPKTADAKKIADTSDCSYLDKKNLVLNKVYYYWIVAKNGDGPSPLSAYNSGYITKVPAAPATVTVSNGTYFDKILVTWPKVTDATSYELYRTPLNLSKKITGATAANPCVITAAAHGFADGDTVMINGVGGTIGTLLNGKYFTVAAATADKFSVSVTGTAAGKTFLPGGTVIPVSPKPLATVNYDSRLATYSHNDTADIADPDPNPANTYYYWVKAVNANGSGALKLSSTVGAIKKTGPTAVLASNGTYEDRVKITWTALPGATSYNVYRKTTVAGITGASADTSCVITANSHGFEVGNKVLINGVTGTIAALLNGKSFVITAITGNTFTVQVNTTGKAYLSGGTATVTPTSPNPKPLPLNIAPVFETAYYDATAVPGITYAYWIDADYNGLYQSGLSLGSNGKISAAPITTLAAPVIKSVSKGDFDYVKIIWGEVPLAESYVIYRSETINFKITDPGVTAIPVPNPLTLSYPDNVVQDYPKKYYYRMTAKNGVKESLPTACFEGYSNPTANSLTNSVPTKAVDGLKDSCKYYSISVPDGTTRLVATLTGTGNALKNDCDLYARTGSNPSKTTYNAKGIETINGESLTVANPASGTWYFMLYGVTDYGNVTLTVNCYSVTDIIITLPPMNDQVVPFTANFKGRVVDETGTTGIANLPLQVRNPLTGITSWLPAKTDAGGYFTYSTLIGVEGEHTFDFFFSTMPDSAKGTASHTVATAKGCFEENYFFDFSAYLKTAPSILKQEDVLGMQTFLDIRNGWNETGIVIPGGTYEELWIGNTVVSASTDAKLAEKLEDGLYLLYYGFEGAAAGNDTTANPELSRLPFAVHVSSGAINEVLTDVLSNLKSLGILDDSQEAEIIAGKIGVVAITALNNPGEGAVDGDRNISMNSSEQLEILANLAAGTAVFVEARKYSNVTTKMLTLTLANGRTINVLAATFVK